MYLYCLIWQLKDTHTNILYMYTTVYIHTVYVHVRIATKRPIENSLRVYTIGKWHEVEIDGSCLLHLARCDVISSHTICKHGADASTV